MNASMEYFFIMMGLHGDYAKIGIKWETEEQKREEEQKGRRIFKTEKQKNGKTGEQEDRRPS